MIPVYRDLDHFPFRNFRPFLNSKRVEEIVPNFRVCEHLGVRAGFPFGQ